MKQKLRLPDGSKKGERARRESSRTKKGAKRKGREREKGMSVKKKPSNISHMRNWMHVPSNGPCLKSLAIRCAMQCNAADAKR